MENKQNLLNKEQTIKQNRIWVRIASACNNKCLFCLDSQAQDGTYPSESSIKKEIKKWFKPWMDNRVIISWGEASINPKFPEYIKYAKELWYNRVQTVTNGNMFASENFCTKVFDAWLEEVTFSFHGHTAQLHDFLVDTQWAFKKSLKGLIYIKKYYPDVIINIDIVVNKVNVKFLPDIVKFYMRLWVYEFDILQIIPFGRWFLRYKDMLFYNVADYQKELQETWELSKVPGMYMWTNRFYAEAFEWYEDLIQDPRKIKSETMGEWYHMFDKFIRSNGKKKPECYWAACDVCFQNQYCHDFLKEHDEQKQDFLNAKIIKWQEFPSQVYDIYWETFEEFKKYLQNQKQELINIPKCLSWSWKYEKYVDVAEEKTLEDYTEKYITQLYRKKSLRCWECKYEKTCKWIHINFIRSYWFKILEPIK